MAEHPGPGEVQASSEAQWEIIALDTGSSVIERSMMTYSVGFGTPIRIPRVMWVLKGPITVVVDTSVGRDGRSSEFMSEPMERTVAQEPANALREAGIDPQDVQLVVLTHLHWDHAGNCDLFPDARILVQRAELRYAIAPGRFFRRFFLAPESGWGAPEYLMPNLETVDGEALLAPGLRVVPSPGHTPGSQSVIAATRHGSFCIAGDAINLYDNIERDVPPGLHVNVDEAVASVDRLAHLADHFLPSHDYEVFSDGIVTPIGKAHASRPGPRRGFPAGQP